MELNIQQKLLRIQVRTYILTAWDQKFTEKIFIGIDMMKYTIIGYISHTI